MASHLPHHDPAIPQEGNDMRSEVGREGDMAANASRAAMGPSAHVAPEAGPSAPAARPILFSAPMVRALLDGRKTQTRRIVKGAPEWAQACHNAGMGGAGGGPWWDFWELGRAAIKRVRCPYGVPGDLLWARETLKRSPDLWTYAADGAHVGWPARRDLAGHARDTIVSIHMPRWASRISLRITDVRVERLNEIDDGDAFAEGVTPAGIGLGFCVHEAPEFKGRTPRAAYRSLWERMNGPDSWAANPFVWAVSFTVERGGTAASPSHASDKGPGKDPK